jgi:hypothetical protein
MYAPFVTLSLTEWTTAQWNFITPGGDLDGDGVNNLTQYLQGRDLRGNLIAADIDGDGIDNVTEDNWAKTYGGAISNKYRMADAFSDPDGDGLMTIEELYCTWGTRKVKDPAAVATNPYLNATGPNVGSTAPTYNLKVRSPPPSLTTAATKWSGRESSPNYKAWMNDGLLRKACRETTSKTAAGVVLPAFFTVKHLLKLTSTVPRENLGYDHLPSGYLDWLVKNSVALPTFVNQQIQPPTPSLSRLNLASQNALNTDADNDGMPNIWEAAYNLDWRDRADASLDQAKVEVSARLRALPLAVTEKAQITDSIIAEIGQNVINAKYIPDGSIIPLVKIFAVTSPPVPPALAIKPTLVSKLAAWEAKRADWEPLFIAYQTWQILNEIDQDHDGLANADEYTLKLNPTIADYSETASRDSDEDGFTDAQEVAAGTSSKDASKFPPFVLEIVSGNNQTGAGVLIHNELPAPIVLRALYKGSPQPGILINFKSSSALNQTLLAQVATGSADWKLNAVQVRTDADGFAKIRVKAPATKGALTITASSVIRPTPTYPFKATTTFPTVPALDTDGDGMPDAWEVTNKLTKTIALDADVSPLHFIPSYHRDTPITLLSVAQQAILALPKETSVDPTVQGLLEDYPLVWTASSLQSKEQIVILQKIDPDHDGLTNLQEYQRSSNPRLPDLAATASRDSDGDGFTNAEEVLARTDYLDPNKVPMVDLEIISGNNQIQQKFLPFDERLILSVKHAGIIRKKIKVRLTASRNDVAFGSLDFRARNWQFSPIVLESDDNGEVSVAVRSASAVANYSIACKHEKDRSNVVSFNLSTIASVTPVIPAPQDDRDGDGLPNEWEIRNQFDPDSPEDAEETFLDNDRDDLNNLDEFTLNTDPHNSDTDSDTMKDGWEVLYGLNPLLNDGQGHSDNDGLTNSREFQLGTDPTKGDTDNDEMPDGWEVLYALDPLNSFDATQDPDADGYPNLMEYANNTSPRVFNAGGNPNSPPSLIRPTKSQVKAIIDEQFTLTPEAACVCILSKTRQSSAVGASYQAKLAGPQSVYYSAFSSSSQTSTYGLHSRAQETIIPNPDESLYTSWHSVKNLVEKSSRRETRTSYNHKQIVNPIQLFDENGYPIGHAREIGSFTGSTTLVDLGESTELANHSSSLTQTFTNATRNRRGENV